MEGIGLIAATFLGLLVFLVVVLQYELDLTLVVATLLAVSITALGLLLAIVLESLVGLSLMQTAIWLGLLLFAVAGTYELVS